jgi:hypothetical protein
MRLRAFSLMVLVFVAMVVGTSTAKADSVDLKTASSFGLLGGTAISNTGTSVVNGNVGVQNTSATITGFNPTGTTTPGFSVIAPGNTLSNNAYTDFVNAFNAAELLTSTGSFAGTSQTFLGGNVYTAGTVSTTTGSVLTFDAQNNPYAVFVIETAGPLTVNGALTFTLKNQAQASNIFWIVGTDATISVGSSGPITFDGDILAGKSFTMSAASGGSGVLAGTINGCVFAETANTLAGTTNVNGCGGGKTVATPEPGTLVLLLSGLLPIGLLMLRKLR